LPRYVTAEGRKRNLAAGWTVLVSGAGISLASLILNNDLISVELSGEDYATYSAIKYASLAGLGLGLGATGLGLGILGGAK
jgi:hypothetical protein